MRHYWIDFEYPQMFDLYVSIYLDYLFPCIPSGVKSLCLVVRTIWSLGTLVSTSTEYHHSQVCRLLARWVYNIATPFCTVHSLSNYLSDVCTHLVLTLLYMYLEHKYNISNGMWSMYFH